MKILKAPEEVRSVERPLLFLSGSIEQGRAGKWQDRLINELSDVAGTILNPRRDDWDSSWINEIDSPQFREQVLWELRGLESADVIAMYFSPETKSPITLLELGLFARSGKLVVFCPEGFWRKGNVDIVCRRYRVTNCSSWDDFVLEVKERLKDTRRFT